MSKVRALIEQDLALIHIQEQPAFFARVERIVPDRKKNWWQVTFLVLQVPVQYITWIIDNEQIRGADFTMGGIPIHIERIVPPELPELAAAEMVAGEEPVKAAPEKIKTLSKSEQSTGTKKTETKKGARILSMGTPQKNK